MGRTAEEELAAWGLLHRVFCYAAPMDRATILLGLGAVTGIAMAAAGLFTGTSSVGGLRGDVAARVNGAVVRRTDYERMVGAVAGDKRNEMTDADRRQVLDRMIEEELLVQRALELGLARVDGRVRRDLTAAMLDSIVAETQSAQPSEQELRTFYEGERELFAGAEQFRVRQLWFRIPTLADTDAVRQRANQAVDLLKQGTDFEAVRAQLADTEVVPLPDALLPASKLTDYLGPTAFRAVQELQPGQWSAPVRSSTGYHVLLLADRSAAPPPPFEQARTEILEAYRRRAGDSALRAYLTDLREAAEVVIAEDLP